MTVPPMNRCSRRYVEGQCERLACHTGPCALTASDGRWVDPVVWADDATPFTGPEVLALLQENESFRKRLERAEHELGTMAASNTELRGRIERGRAARDELLSELAALRQLAEAARIIVRGYPSYPSWGAAEHALHDALEAASKAAIPPEEA